MNLEELDKPIFSAADAMASRQARIPSLNVKPPQSVILCFQSSTLSYAIKHYRSRKLSGFVGDTYWLRSGSTAIAGHFGIGAPAAVTLLEEFAAWGACNFISIGLAGGLQPHLESGDLIVCDRAVRDEGTSNHYLPPAKFAFADPFLVQHWCRILDARPQSYTIGSSWTTDAPYRETHRQVETFSQEGICAVEMEAAGLFAAGQHLGVHVAAGFAIADSVNSSRRQLNFDAARTQRGLQILCDSAIQVLAETK